MIGEQRRLGERDVPPKLLPRMTGLCSPSASHSRRRSSAQVCMFQHPALLRSPWSWPRRSKYRTWKSPASGSSAFSGHVCSMLLASQDVVDHEDQDAPLVLPTAIRSVTTGKKTPPEDLPYSWQRRRLAAGLHGNVIHAADGC
jgi:hypothetical protein